MLFPRKPHAIRWPRIRSLLFVIGILAFLAYVTASFLDVTVSSAIYYTNSIDRSLPVPDPKQEYPPGTKITDKFLSSKKDMPFQIGCQIPKRNQRRADAVLVVLARNTELNDVISSISSLERHFNQWYNYPWVFLNDEPFTDEFKAEVSRYTTSKVEFGQIPVEEWNFKKENMNSIKYEEAILGQGDRRILYGNMESYHKMCRFFLGYFYQHELVKNHEWYWRVEPGVEFYCDITYDPFLEMEKRGKKYGFTVMIGELYYTVPGLFKTTKQFIQERQIEVKDTWKLFSNKEDKLSGSSLDVFDGLDSTKHVTKRIQEKVKLKLLLEMNDKTDNDISAVSLRNTFKWLHSKPILYEDRFGREEYNLCHFWSNFEIAKTSIFQSPLYRDYFEYLENAGGFYKERWGDAPVHLLAIGMLLELEEIHYFRDIGYKHSSLIHCPYNAENKQLLYEEGREYNDNQIKLKKGYLFTTTPLIDKPRANGVGCRCKCPGNEYVEMEESTCFSKWWKLTNDDYRNTHSINVDSLERRITSQIRRRLRAGEELHKIDVT